MMMKNFSSVPSYIRQMDRPDFFRKRKIFPNDIRIEAKKGEEAPNEKEKKND
ncbi:MAG: hypothetical protein IK109_00100 [Clostridiales bacterium]|nr:hypothetical protein [Clostridiales bacterium]